jgi:hypothetical protein
MLLEKENVNEVQRHGRNEFGTPPPTCVRVAWLYGKFGVTEQHKLRTGNSLKTMQFNRKWK